MPRRDDGADTAPMPVAARPRPVTTPLTPTVGAVVSGVDLAAIDDTTAGELAALVVHHGMVAVPGQELDEDAQVALAARFGTVTPSPLRRFLGSRRACSLIEDTAEHAPAGFDWHTDESWTATPPAFGFLHALTIPACGGDTIWVDTTAAYERLPAPLRRVADTLSVVHHMGEEYLATVARHHGEPVAEELQAAHPPIEHPLVRMHPVTGRRALWLSPLYTRSIAGVDERSGRELLTLFERSLEDPHVQVRWRWSEGDVVIWDEAATCHRALTDHYPATRRMRRCTTAGTRPVGVG
jgi:alpha-ketoglutarate-dependent taurine dioxygenase